MVNAAYSSGTPALGVGVGNAVITVDESADLDAAAEKIRISKTLDLAASCSSDNSVVLLDSIYETMLDKLKAQGGYLCNEEEKTALATRCGTTITPEYRDRGTATEKIAQMAGLSIPEETRFFIVPEDGWGREHPFSGEKLSVIMALYRARDIDHAIELTQNIQAYQGQGHSCGIYSNNDANIMKLAENTYTSRVMVNQPKLRQTAATYGTACARHSRWAVDHGAATAPTTISPGETSSTRPGYPCHSLKRKPSRRTKSCSVTSSTNWADIQSCTSTNAGTPGD